MNIRNIVKEFKKHSVSVYGERGSGKDLLTANVIERRKEAHVANIKYNERTIPYRYEDIAVGNTYLEFNSGRIKKYVYPFPDGTDIYLSDCGVYFPSQYCNELNKLYKDLPTFLGLSRHLGECSVHTSSQALGRVWDKIREQSVVYIQCLSVAKWLLKLTRGKLVIQRIRIYDKYESALEKRLQLRIRLPALAKRESKAERQMRLDEYTSAHGHIKERTLIYINKSHYDTRAFREVLKNGT